MASLLRESNPGARWPTPRRACSGRFHSAPVIASVKSTAAGSPRRRPSRQASTLASVGAVRRRTATCGHRARGNPRNPESPRRDRKSPDHRARCALWEMTLPPSRGRAVQRCAFAASKTAASTMAGNRGPHIRELHDHQRRRFVRRFRLPAHPTLLHSARNQGASTTTTGRRHGPCSRSRLRVNAAQARP